jgi:O-antigen/teichoic acid export membrane protein
LIGATVGITLSFHGYGYWSLLAQQIVLQLAMLVLCSHATRFIPGLKLDANIGVGLTRFIGLTFWSVLLNVATNRIDVLVLGLHASSVAVGNFSLAKRIIQIVQDLVASSFDKALVSLKSRSASVTSHRMLYKRSVIAQAALLLPTFVGFALVAPYLIPIAFGSDWQTSATLIGLMTVGGIFRSLVTVERAEQVVEGTAAKLLYVRFIEAIFALLLIVPFADAGPEYMSIVFSIRYVVGYLLVVRSRLGAAAGRHTLSVAGWIWAPVASTMVMIPVTLASMYSLPTWLPATSTVAIAAVVGGLCYCGLMAILRMFWLTPLLEVET